MSLALACAIGLLAMPGGALAQPMPNGVPGNWQIILNEEFGGNGLNTKLWTPGWQHGGVSGPMNKSCVSAANVSQPGNGFLYLELKHQANTCEWGGERVSGENTGALVESNPGDGVSGHTGFSYLYGYVEWRVWIPGVEPSGAGCPRKGCIPDFPALWSLPGSHASEIDTMEGLGTKGQACFHLPPPFGSSAPGACTSAGYAGSWHTFGANWEPNGTVTYYYDGTDVGQLSSGYLTEPQYLVMDIINPIDGQPLLVPNTLTVEYVRVWRHPALDTVGVDRPSNHTFYLSNSNTAPKVDITVPNYGAAGDIPAVGNWTGDGVDTVGVYRPSNHTFYLSNSNTAPKVDIIVPNYGVEGDIAVVGDWNGDGVDTVGVYRPSNHAFYLSNSNTAPKVDIIVPNYGAAGDIAVVGDWTGVG
ncbi:MAG: hypothetical protein H0X28_07485 [Solirubrobacterales bacterium]|nr:hypothetical protein [Solirubrobacterales bacterium]